MVSAISARLLAGTRNDSPLSERLVAASRGSSDASSQSSNGSLSTHKKRTASGAVKQASSTAGTSENIEGSLSGYSGDKEDTSVNPPVYSIGFLGREKKNTSPGHARSSDINPAKRQKTDRTTFAVTTAKNDLERAGMEFKAFNRDNEEVTAPGSNDVTIKLKGVRLVYSNEVSAPLISSNVSSKCTVEEYEALAQAVSDSYPSSPGSGLKAFDPSPSTQDNGSSDSQSTSSVSDTNSDVDSSDNNNGSNDQIFVIPPRVEDSLDPSKTNKFKKLEPMSTCNIISCASNATTMTESLQLSTEPRVVTLSTSPYSIIHANAAFMRLAGKKSAGNVLGTSFTSFLDSDANADRDALNLTNCMVSSSMGNDSKLFLLPKTLDDVPMACAVRVAPIVARKTESREVTTISHFVIELFESMNDDSLRGAAMGTSPAHSRDAAVGVMG